jgi:PAS domain S-box-containing protein
MRGAFKLGAMRAKMPMRIRLALFAMLFALPVLLLAVLQVQRDSHRIHDAAKAAVNRAADGLARRLADDLVGAETVARAIGAVDSRPVAGSTCSLALKRAVQGAGPRIADYIATAPTGQVLCSGQPFVQPVNLADRLDVQQALRTRRPALSGLISGRNGASDSLQLVVPHLDASDSRVSLLAIAAFTPATLVTGLQAEGDLSMTLALFDREGVLVSRTPQNQAVPPGLPAAGKNPFRQRVALTGGTTELRGLDGVARLYTSRPVPLHGETVLWVTSGVDVRALDAAMLAAGARDLGIVLLLAVVVGGLAFVTTRTLVLERYRGLVTVVADVAVGNYGSRVPVIVQDDVTPVEVALNGMLGAVEADRNALATANGALVQEIARRELAELAMQRSQRQLRHLIDGLSPSMFVALLTPQGVLVEVNQSPLTAAGVQAQSVVGMPFVETPWWRGSPLAQQQLRSAIERGAEGEPSQYEVTIAGRHEESIDMDFSLQPLRDDAGHVIFLVASAVVITERKRAETALRESESVFHALTDSMPQIVWMTGTDGLNVYFNQRWTDYTGLTPQESSGAGWLKPVHPDDQQRASAAWELATATFGTYMLECRLRRADGAYRWWLLRGEPQRDGSGVVIKWVGTCTDVHDMKLAVLEISRANAELEQQQTELRVLFDLMPAIIMFKDTGGRILRINRHGAIAAGRPVEEIEGRLASEIYPGVGAQDHAQDMEVIRSGQPRLGTVQKIQDRHGNEVWVQRDRVPYHDAEGKVIGFVLMVQDVSQRKRDQDALHDLNTELESRVRRRTDELNQARSQAEHASRAKSEFLAAMSHEIRTPMSGLLALMELLQLSVLDDEQHATLMLARESGSALLSMIDDILDFSKIEANRLDLNLMPGSVKAIIDTVCRLQSQLASSKNLVLHCHVAPEISPVLAVDPLRLGQILNNLLNNAIKFTERGSVEVRAELAGRHGKSEDLRFIVRDSGIGMTQQQLERLFQPFVQADATTSTRYGGTGLGLVIARRLAQLMGGSVEIESVPGQGTTLTLRLSLEVCDDAVVTTAIPGPRELLETAVAGRRIAPSVQDAQAEDTLLLVADDHPTNRLVLVRQLASLGYAAEAAEDGVQALALWRTGRFAAVITDCNMPRMNGYELAVAIRESERERGLGRAPIIACTANALPSARDLCMVAGMDDCLVKPADLATVGEVLDRWVPLARGHVAAPPPAATVADSRAAAFASGLLDTVLLTEISGDDPGAQAQLLAGFRQANEQDAKALRQAANAEDITPVVLVSHRIKGASLMMGATCLSDACGRIEAAGAANDRAALDIAMTSFEVELARLNNYLDTWPAR